MRIAFLSRWESADHTFARHCWMTPGRGGRWGALAATRSLWRARYVVVHHGLPGRRYSALPPWRLLLFRHEPSHFDPHWPEGWLWSARFVPPAYQQSFGTGRVPMVATWWINMDYDDLSALRPPPKTRLLSCIASAKTMIDGHRQRLAFLHALAARHGSAVDIFGRGLESQRLGAAYKGELDRDAGFPLGRRCKYDGLRDYRYSLCIENGRERNYCSEKIIDAWLSWTVPIYWGCPNLSEFYPREAFVELDITAPDAADEVIRRSREPVSRVTMEAIAEARYLALNRYSTWGTVQHLLNERFAA
ncbi:MAG: glycosyltransferase family 10 [Candidatus Binatia bacterium]